MALLDRFRSSSPETHPDAAVRLQFVSELALDDREAIARMAREDADPRVRRAAVAKLLDPIRLAPIARSDTDESVRGQALDMLRDIALESFEGTSVDDSVAAVDALADADLRRVAQVVKATSQETVAARALARLTDPRALGSVARHAVCESARRQAFERLRAAGETGELLNVALNAEHKDVGLAAVECFSSRTDLQQIATRSRNKSAARRASSLVKEMDERVAREAAEAEAARRAASSSQRAIMSDAAMVSSTDPDRLAALEAERAQAADRAQAAERARREAAVRAEADAAARVAERDRALSELADHAGPLAALEPLAEATRRLAQLRTRWEALSAGHPVEAATYTRFADAEAAVHAREQQAQESAARVKHEALQRLQTLLARVEPLPAKTDLSLKAAERALRDVRAMLADPPEFPSQSEANPLLARLSAAHDQLAPKASELREADEWQKWANVTVQEQLCTKMEALAALDDVEAIARDVRQLQQQWRTAADVPRDKADALWKRFKAAHDVAWARCEARFAAQAEARAENLARKIACCEQAEALADSTQWIQAAEAIKKLQSEWKTIGPAARGREKEVWDRFRTACDRFFTRRHADLTARKAVWSENLAKKDALCARVEALSASTDWESTAGEIKRLQAEWRTIGPVKKTRSEAIWQRFRAACDAFFERYTHRHELARGERVAAREAICAELEALAPALSPEPGPASPDPTIVAAPDDRPAPAADSPAPAPGAPLEPAELLATVRTIRSRWRQEIAQRGVDYDRARVLDARFAAAMARVLAHAPAAFAHTELDVDANRQRLEGLVRKVEDLARALAGPAAAADAALSPSSRLAAMLKEALAANTIGGRVEDDSRLRAAAADLAQAQASWSQVGDVPDEVRRPLADRFQRAARLVSEKVGGAARSESGGARPAGGRPPGRPRDERRPGGPPRPQSNGPRSRTH